MYDQVVRIVSHDEGGIREKIEESSSRGMMVLGLKKSDRLNSEDP
jgi:hypothetical protein